MDLFDLRLWNGFQASGGNLTHPAPVNQITVDSRNINSNQALFVAIKGLRHDGHNFVAYAAKAGAKYALVSDLEPLPSISGLTYLRVKDPLTALQEIASTYRQQLPTKIIGITGSFGKTMVKDLLLSLLATQFTVAASPESFNSQIGVPLSLLTLRKEDEFAIIEAAISKKDEMDTLAATIKPDFTIVTPVGKKHLATLNDLPTLMHEMAKFVIATSEGGWKLIPHSMKTLVETAQTLCWDEFQPDLPYAKEHQSKRTLSTPYTVTFPDKVNFEGVVTGGYTYFINLINMAIKAAWLLGISSHNICRVLDNFSPEPIFTEIWKSPKGSIFVNEPYCSDPQSIDKALAHFDYASPDHRKIFVFGGLRGNHQDSSYKRIGQALAKSGLDDLILIGNHSFKTLINEVEKESPETIVTAFADQTEAFHFLNERVQPLDYIVLKGDKKIPLDTLTEIFHDSLSNNQCMINLAAIKTNISLIRKQLPPNTRLMVAVKALAYGTDDIRLAKFLHYCGIDILCVSYVDEGIALKRAGVIQSIFTINAANYEASKAVKWDLEVGVSDLELVHSLAKEAKKQQKQVKVHLHIDTGMGRFGCRPENALEIAKAIKSYPELIFEGLMTHFACADDPKEDHFTRQQIAAFDQVIEQLKQNGITANWNHAANSSAAVRFNLPQYNMVRVGLAAYGLYLSDEAKDALDLRLALSLTSRIVGINICKKGETVSYGKSYTVERDEQKIAILPIGYFDGLHRNYSGKSSVIIRGKRAPMIGNICMDYMMVDVTDIPGVSVGDRVLIFGHDEFGHYIAPEELAAKGNSIIHELITCLGPRIQRIFVDEESHLAR